jgi:glutamate-5-semialdehyde dehydrogenase (EC 1.2.1.41)
MSDTDATGDRDATDNAGATDQAIETKVDAAEAAALDLANVDDSDRQAALQAIADAIDDNREPIQSANAADVEAAEELLEAGEYTQALVDRLKLSDAKLDSIVEMVRSVAAQDDPLGKTLEARELDENLELYKLAAPIGVVGTVFESRPDALVQIAALGLKSGNSVMLKGGSEASESNRVLFDLIREATADHDAIPEGWAQLVEARADVTAMLEMDDSIDLLMPRGSSEFVQYVQDNTSIPVLGHTEGVCHVYVDREADLDMATEVALTPRFSTPRSATPSKRCSSTRPSLRSISHRSPHATPRLTWRSAATSEPGRSSTWPRPARPTGRPSTAILSSQ